MLFKNRDLPDRGESEAFTERLEHAYICILFHECDGAASRRCEVDVGLVDYHDALEFRVLQQLLDIHQWYERPGRVSRRTQEYQLYRRVLVNSLLNLYIN